MPLRTRRLPHRISLGLALGLNLAAPLSVLAWEGPDLVTGYNVLRLNTYHNGGDTSASPYPYDGAQYEDSFGLIARKRVSAWESLDLGLDATLNHSQYRDPNDFGLDLDRLRLNWEKGDAAIPFRLQGGDIFVGFGALTAETSLKGLQVDLQPRAQGHYRDSIQLFAGKRLGQWDSIGKADSGGLGASWLRDFGSDGAFSLNFVHNHRQDDPANGIQGHSQQTLSLAGNRDFTGSLAKSHLEAEYALFRGEHPASAGQPRHDAGRFLEWRGDLLRWPLDYRLKYSRYGQDFRPYWGGVTADQQNAELHLGWKLPGRQRLRLRMMNLRDGNESGNPLGTRVVGLNLSGGLPARFLGTLDGYRSTATKADGSSDSRTDGLRLTVGGPLLPALLPGVYLNSGLAWLRTDDRTAANNDSASRQLDLGLGFQVAAGGWSGRINPGVQWRRTSYSSAAGNLAALLNFSLARGPHDISLAMRRSTHDYDLPTSADLEQLSVDARYRYHTGRHTLGVEYNRFERYPDTALQTRAWHLGFSWRYDLEVVAKAAATAGRPQTTRAPTAAAAGKLHDLLDLKPGMAWPQALAHLKASPPAYLTPEGQRLLAGLDLVPESGLEQQLVLLQDGGDLASAHLVFNPRDTWPAALQSAFSQLRSRLVKRYGIPGRVLEKGEFDSLMAEKLTVGEFARVYQWQAAGHVLRFGIPWRADGKWVFELAILPQGDDLTKRDWGLAY